VIQSKRNCLCKQCPNVGIIRDNLNLTQASYLRFNVLLDPFSPAILVKIIFMPVELACGLARHKYKHLGQKSRPSVSRWVGPIRALSAASAAKFNIEPVRWQHPSHVAIVPPENKGKSEGNDWDTACRNFKTSTSSLYYNRARLICRFVRLLSLHF
jgi:hypothetical protein